MARKKKDGESNALQHVNFYLPPDLIAYVRAVAAEEQRSTAGLIRLILLSWKRERELV